MAPDINPLYGDSPRNEMLRLVPETALRVLDVGCHRGAFGAALKAARDVEVWGVEFNRESAAIAASRLDTVLTGTFEGVQLPSDHFDAVVFNDVLEHLVDPWAALTLARSKLRSGGVVIASIPNIRHIENLLHIVRDGDFQYEPAGIRDHTHLRFFTRKSIVRLFEDSGFVLQHLEGINPEWWTPSIRRRLAYRLFTAAMEDTKFIQFAVVARARLAA